MTLLDLLMFLLGVGMVLAAVIWAVWDMYRKRRKFRAQLAAIRQESQGDSSD